MDAEGKKHESENHTGACYLSLTETVLNASRLPSLCTNKRSTTKTLRNPTELDILPHTIWVYVPQISTICGAYTLNNKIRFFGVHDSHFDDRDLNYTGERNGESSVFST